MIEGIKMVDEEVRLISNVEEKIQSMAGIHPRQRSYSSRLRHLLISCIDDRHRPGCRKWGFVIIENVDAGCWFISFNTGSVGKKNLYQVGSWDYHLFFQP